MKINVSHIRQNALVSIYHAESGHPGGVLSCIDFEVRD